MRWIKINNDLLTSPKVALITSRVTSRVTSQNVTDVTRVTRTVIGALCCVWLAVNSHAADDGETVRFASLATIDQWAGIVGFGADMESVGWVEVSADGLIFRGFGEHNKPTKARTTTAKTAAERAASYRAKLKSVTNSVTENHVTETENHVTVTPLEKRREEKRREDILLLEKEAKGATHVKNKKIERPADVSEKIWQGFLAVRKAKNAPLTEAALDGIQREASKAKLTLEAALTHCCECNWQGFKAEWLQNQNNFSQGKKPEIPVSQPWLQKTFTEQPLTESEKKQLGIS